MILATVGTAIVVWGFLMSVTTPIAYGGNPPNDFVVGVMIGGPLAAFGLLLVAIRKPEKKTPKGGSV